MRSATSPCSSKVLPVGKAMKELHKQLLKAETTYTGFQRDYDQEVSSIQIYATDDMLKKLWVLKATGRRFNRSSDQDQNYYNDHRSNGLEDDELPAARFEKTNKRIRQALQDALNSSPTEQNCSRRQKARMDATERMREKIDTATGQITKLLHSAVKGREYCEALLREVEHLRSLVDPEKNHDLYDPVNDVEDDEGAEADDEDMPESPSSDNAEVGRGWD